MRVHKFALPVFALAPLISVVLIAQFTGAWATSGKAMVDMENLRPEEIRGWMTWQQVSDSFAIPLDELYRQLAVPAEIPPSTALKDMETLVDGFETTAVREAVAAYLTGQAAGDAEPLLPLSTPPAAPAETATASNLSIDGVVPTADAVATTPAAAITPQVHVPQGEGTGIGTGPTLLPPGQILPAGEIKGRHTLAEVADLCAVPLEELIAMLGLPVETASGIQVKSLLGDGSVVGIEAVRDAVATLQQAGK